MRERFTPLTSTFAALLLVTGVLLGCAAPAPPEDEEPDLARIVEEQLGLAPLISIREVMTYIIDPMSDWVFNAVGYDVFPEGIVETVPETAEDWLQVRQGALVLAEGMNLMKIPRPVAPAGRAGGGYRGPPRPL
jgi:hypothetical protein